MNTPYFYSQIFDISIANQISLMSLNLADSVNSLYIQKIGVICYDPNGVILDNTIGLKIDNDNNSMTNEYIHADLIANNAKNSQNFLPEIIVQKNAGSVKLSLKNLRQDHSHENNNGGGISL